MEIFLSALVDLSNAMAVYILFGLVFAGVLHELVPESIVSSHLGRNSVGSVIKATLFGIPLPVCSCGVIPLAASIKKSGASNGATLSFLISTPITGIDSILATYGMFGWAFTLYRVLTSTVIAMAAGILSNLWGDEVPSSGRFAPSAAKNFTLAPRAADIPAASKSCDEACSCTPAPAVRRFSLKRAIHYAFVTLLGDIAVPLIWGIVAGALISAAIPENLSEVLKEYAWISYAIVIAIAVPMYVCATASLPIAAGLMMAGVSPGAAFVFLSAGPATNTVTIGVVKSMLGNRALTVYLGSIMIGSIAFGVVLDWMVGTGGFDPIGILAEHEEAGIVAVVSSVVLWPVVAYHAMKKWLKKSSLVQ